MDKDLLKSPFEKQKGRGRPKFFDELLIAALCLRYVYSLPLRALSGFLKSLIELNNIEAPLPHYSLYSKRMAYLKLPKLSKRRPFHLLVDASGVKVTGEGEWKVKIHGASNRSKWLKLHINNLCDETGVTHNTLKSWIGILEASHLNYYNPTMKTLENE